MLKGTKATEFTWPWPRPPRRHSNKAMHALFAVLLLLVAACASPPGSQETAATSEPTVTSEPAQTSPPASSQPEQRSIAVTMLPGVLEELFTPFLDEFTQETGIEVEFVLLPFDELRSKVLLDLAGGGAEYDVVLVSEAWMGEFGDLLMPLDDYIASAPGEYDFDDLIDASLAGGNYQGAQVGIPWRDAARMLYYNESMLKEAGFDGAPETLEELREYAIALTRDGKWGLGIQGESGWAAAIEFMSVLCSWGGSLLNDGNTAAAFNSPEGVEALEYYVDLVHGAQVVPPAAVSWNWDPIITGMQQGDIAMTIAYAPYAPLMDDPEVSTVVGEIQYAPAPSGVRSCTVGAAWQLSIPESAPDPDAAWEFIEYFTSKEIQTAMTPLGNTPVRSSVYEDPAVAGDRRDFPVAARALADSVRLPAIPELTEVMDIFGAAVNEALTQVKTPAAALEEAAADVDALLGG